MKLAWLLGIICAIVLHAGVILFGGLLLPREDDDRDSVREVELLSEDDAEAEKEKDKPKDSPAEKSEELETETEQAPDAAEILRNLELSPVASAPELDAASLSAIEQALSGQAGGGDFADALSFSSGGRIGGTGKGGPMDERLETAFSLAEIDQKPRPILQGAPLYPAEMRGKKIEAGVTVIFVVDSSGRVSNPRIEKSTHPAFEKPALDAVKQWKFEPAVKAGQRVGCKLRVPIRFQAT